MNAASFVVAALVVGLLVLFVLYWLSVWHMPSGRRPITPEYDRFGRIIGLEENPDYAEEAPDEGREDRHADD